jgi:plastocyanin
MRKHRAVVIGSVMALVVLGMSGMAQAGGGGGNSGRGGGAEVIEAQDDCEPTSFNAAIGPETCVKPGDTVFDDFIGQLIADGAADDWEFHSDDTHIDQGERLKVVGAGGEFHTFTRVDQFAGGCVPEINDILGLDYLGDETCGRAFQNTGVPSGVTVTVNNNDLKPGVNKFQCVIHPWMQATVEVRAQHHH